MFGDKEVQSRVSGLSKPIPTWVIFKDFTEMEKGYVSLSSKIMQVFLLFFFSTLTSSLVSLIYSFNEHPPH